MATQLRRREKESLAVVSELPPLPIEPEPFTVTPGEPRPDPVPSGDPVLAQHQANLSALRAELAEVTRLRETGVEIVAELAEARATVDRIADELLASRGSDPCRRDDEPLGKAAQRKASLGAELERLHKRQHAAELGLQSRLTADIRAVLRLEGAWTLFGLDRETDKFLAFLVENRRDALWEECRKCAEASISYSATLASLGERPLESFAWSRPLDGLESEKTPWATQHIGDPLYAAPSREAIIALLLDTSAKTVSRWEVLLGLVASATGFGLPSYEEPPITAEIPPQYPDTTRELSPFWTAKDMEHPPWEAQTFSSPPPLSGDLGDLASKRGLKP
jgi:hypothetical protein